MVKVGDTFTCDKISLEGAPDDYLDHYDKKAFSKGVFTLLDLGPPTWKSRYSSYQHYVKVKDRTGTEGWINIKDFDSYRRGYKYRPEGIIKRWISYDQLRKERNRRDERKEARRIEKEGEKEKENQKEAPSSTQRSLLAHLKPKDRTASGGSTSRDSGIGELVSEDGKMRADQHAFFVFVRKSYGIPSFADFASSKPRDLTLSSDRIIIIRTIWASLQTH